MFLQLLFLAEINFSSFHEKVEELFSSLPSESTENFSNPNQLKALSPSLTHLQVF